MRRTTGRAIVFGCAALAGAVGFGRAGAQVVPYNDAQLDLEVRIRPIPVRAGDKLHLRYELHATGFQANPVEIVRLDVLAGDAEGREIRRFEAEDLDKRILRLGAPADPQEKRVILPGARAIVFVELDFDARGPGDLPAALRHRLAVRTGREEGKPAPRDREGVVAGAPLSIRREEPLAIGPPLRGDRWCAINGDDDSAHRRTVMAGAGRATVGQRYAIDWMRFGPDNALFHDDKRVNANYYGYGAEALAVAEGTVVDIKDGIPENVASSAKMAVPLTFETLGGNYVMLDLGGGRFAYYAHLQPGSLMVRRGDHASAGAVLGLVGNSGNSDAPHLHFHIGDANTPVGSEGIPYAYSTFEVQGRIPEGFDLDRNDRWIPPTSAGRDVRRLEFPNHNEVLRFP